MRHRPQKERPKPLRKECFQWPRRFGRVSPGLIQNSERLRWHVQSVVVSLALCVFLLLCQFLYAQTSVPVFVAFQGSAPPPAVTAQAGSVIQDQYGAQGNRNLGRPSDLAESKPQLAPAVRPWPFLRLAAILLAGFAISAARLARKFRRFLGLGVFINAYSAVFLMLTVGISGLPVTSETTLSSHIGSWGPWIADLSGIIAALVLPAIRLKASAAAASPVLHLEDTASSNPVLAAIEDGIRDHILARMQAEIVAASRRYNWEEIKLAARRLLEEEITVGRLGREDGEVAIQSIAVFQPSADPRTDFDNKYTALIRLLRSCSFSRLRQGLAAVARETGP
jgi:hypothetical protein